MPGLEELSREELLTLVSAQAKTIEVLTARPEVLEARLGELEARVGELEAENAELKRRLGQNSWNSSEPPSSDDPEHVAPPRSLRRRSGRKRGKQPGAQGFSLRLADDPDETVDHVPGCCSDCGAGLVTAVEAGVVRREVTDIAPAVATVTERRLHRRRCACGTVATVPAPAGVAEAQASYGPDLRAWVVTPTAPMPPAGRASPGNSLQRRRTNPPNRTCDLQPSPRTPLERTQFRQASAPAGSGRQHSRNGIRRPC